MAGKLGGSVQQVAFGSTETQDHALTLGWRAMGKLQSRDLLGVLIRAVLRKVSPTAIAGERKSQHNGGVGAGLMEEGALA